MAKPWAVGFYHSKAWRKTQRAYMESFVETDRGVCPPYMCERCFSLGVMRPAEIVHHIKPITESTIGDPDITLSTSNLMRVCRECHAELHRGCSGYVPRVAFDEDGRVISIG